MSPVYNKNISLIVAIAENNAIGKNNELLWKISDDLKRFKKLTTGHKVIMGRNTFLSLPNGPLPNRENIIITDNENENFEGCEMAYSVEEALANVQEDEEAFHRGVQTKSPGHPWAHQLPPGPSRHQDRQEIPPERSGGPHCGNIPAPESSTPPGRVGRIPRHKRICGDLHSKDLPAQKTGMKKGEHHGPPLGPAD